MENLKKHKNKIYFGIILLGIYLILGLIISFGLSNKLNSEEYEVVSNIYREMRYVDMGIKNDFYGQSLIKYLDKDFILEELHRDSLIYSVVVSENAFTMLSNEIVPVDIRSYISRCELNFEDIVGLETPTKLFDLYREYFSSFTDDIENLEVFSKKMTEIVQEEQVLISKTDSVRFIIGLLVIVSYMGIFVLFLKIKENRNSK